MNVSNTKDTAASSALLAAATSPSTLAAARQGTAAAKEDAQQPDLLTTPPTPLRFPWLSRLSNELEQASNKPSPYGSAPVIGDNLNEAA